MLYFDWLSVDHNFWSGMKIKINYHVQVYLIQALPSELPQITY